MSKHIYSTTVEVEVDVDIDTDNLTDEDLIEVCRHRGIFVGTGDAEDDITEMFYAFKLGKSERAMELAKQIAQDRTGRIL